MPRKQPRPRRVTVIRYLDSDGRRCTSDTPGARRVKTLSDSFYLHLPPRRPGAKRERIPLDTTDEAIAWHRARLILSERKQEDLGILSDRERQAARPIAEHLDEWLTSVADSGATAKWVNMLRARVSELIGLAGWKRIGDIKLSNTLRALASLQTESTRGRGVGRGGGVSAQTRNHYAKNARQFTHYLQVMGRLTVDPLATLGAVSTEDDRRHDRRVPSDEEIRVLFDHLDGQQTILPEWRAGMSGPQRALGYQLAMCAGLRANELRRLTQQSFNFESCEVKVTGRSDKARKRRVLAIPRWLAAKVRDWLERGGELWEGFPPVHPGRLLHADLDLARAGYLAGAVSPEDRAARETSTVCRYEVTSEDGPLYWDMHALRHWYITQVAATEGIAPSTLQALARHADPKLTLGVYARAQEGGVRKAVEQLPRLDGE